MFMNNEQSRVIATGLDKKNPLEVSYEFLSFIFDVSLVICYAGIVSGITFLYFLFIYLFIFNKEETSHQYF